MVRVDVHQHRWSEPLVAALAARSAPPRLRRRDGTWWLELADEPPSVVDPAADDVATRSAELATDGVDRALIAHSPALGLDALPAAEARAIAAAHAEGCRELPAERFGWWAALPLADASGADVDAALDAGAAGLCLPSGALATPGAVAALGPLLARLEDRDAPLFVHPGPPQSPASEGRGRPAPAASPTGEAGSVRGRSGASGIEAAGGARGTGRAGGTRDPSGEPPTPGAATEPVPAWWPALAAYVPGMHVAWHAWAAAGRSAHPRLRVLWAMLAGLAPLHAERLAARGGPASAVGDPLAFFDTSSYGAGAQSAMASVVGLDRLVHGSDRPVVVPPPAPGALGEPAWDALTRTNPARLLGPRA